MQVNLSLRNTTYPHGMRPKMVLIDDDNVYRSILESFAWVRGVNLDHYGSLQEMGSIGKLSQYDLAIVDYDLGDMNGVEIAEYLDFFRKNADGVDKWQTPTTPTRQSLAKLYQVICTQRYGP